MKRTLTVLICVLALLLCGCANQKQDTEKTDKETGEETTGSGEENRDLREDGKEHTDDIGDDNEENPGGISDDGKEHTDDISDDGEENPDGISDDGEGHPNGISNDGNETDSVIFTDALNRTVSVKKHPERTAALLGSFADVWTLAGGSLCAAAEDAWEDFGLELTDAVNIGGAHSPSLELLLSASPDFVIASASTASNVDMQETLEEAGIPTAYFDVDNFSDYLDMLDICTDITGRKDLYEQNGLKIQTQIESVKSQYAQADIPEEERTVLLIRTSASSIKAKGSSGTILGEMLADMGCINIADQDDSLLENLSVEAVIQREPYRVFVVPMGDDVEGAKAALNTMIQENPAWNSLEAIQKNRMYFMDKTLFNLKPNARWGEAYQKLYETLTEE